MDLPGDAPALLILDLKEPGRELMQRLLCLLPSRNIGVRAHHPLDVALFALDGRATGEEPAGIATLVEHPMLHLKGGGHASDERLGSLRDQDAIIWVNQF